jgi:carbon-monoxide dehydrogenase medium subunit
MQVPALFEYRRAANVDEALAMLEQGGEEARLLAGGHSLLPMMRLRLATPETLIDVNDLTELDYLRLEGDTIAIGALTRHATLLDSPLLAEHYRIFAEAERVIADPLVRNRGTIGGSLCQADPAEDLSAVCCALRAEAVIRSSSGDRTLPVRELDLGPYETAVQPAEILTEVRIPVRPGSGSAYAKVHRRAGDWAIAAAGAFVRLDGDTIVDVGIGLAALGAPGMTCPEVEQALIGGPATHEAFDAAARGVAETVDPPTDQRGPADYKRHLAGELTRRALNRAFARATAVPAQRGEH